MAVLTFVPQECFAEQVAVGVLIKHSYVSRQASLPTMLSSISCNLLHIPKINSQLTKNIMAHAWLQGK